MPPGKSKATLSKKTGETPPIKSAGAAGTRERRYWTFWRLLAWAALFLLLAVLMAGAYLWQNRYDFLETTFEDILAEQGLDADLSIQSISRSAARLSDISMTANGEPVFSAESLSVEYEWRDALNGQMKRIDIRGADLRITLDKDGNIVDGWGPDGSPSSAPTLPPQGLHLIESRIEINSPYGGFKATGDLDFLSLDNLQADVKIEPGEFNFGALSLNGGGTIKANIQPGENEVKTALLLTQIEHPLGIIDTASLEGDVTFDLIDGLSHISGPLTLTFSGLKGARMVASGGTFKWDGDFAVKPDSAAIRKADGQWEVSLENGSYGSAQDRLTLARTLTAYDAMAAAPGAMHFADSLARSVGALMTEAKLSGSGQFLRLQDDVIVTLKDPLTINARGHQAQISPLTQAPFYQFNRSGGDITLALNLQMDGETPISLTGLRAKARSQNGVSLTDISSVQAQAQIPHEWRAQTDLGPARLAPLSTKVSYINKNGRRDMTAAIALDYDGPLPGGYGRSVKGDGELMVDMRGGGLKTTFLPRSNIPVTMGSFTMPSGWTAHDAVFTLSGTSPLYEREEAKSGTLKTTISDASARITEDATGREIAFTIGEADVSATIVPSHQDWTIGLTRAQAVTDDFVGPGTQFGAPEAALTARLVPLQDTSFTLSAEAASVKTQELSTEAIKIQMSGTPQNYHLDFGGETYGSAGEVIFADESLPALPLRGAVSFKDGKFTGESFTVLPEAEDVEIDISFEMQDGTGSAQVMIPQLTFTPGKLQPQNLVPSLQGKIASVTGTVAAAINLSFAPDQPLQSSGAIKINDMNFGTLPGPFTGVSTDINLTSVFPLQTSGLQTLTVDKFNPGVPLENGTMTYELIPNGVQIVEAKWPMGSGSINFDPVVWRFDRQKNRVVLSVNAVELGDLIGELGGEDLEVTGRVQGQLPLVVDGVNVNVEEGVMRVADGGVIKFSVGPKKVIEATAAELNSPDRLSEMALESLRDLRYETLEARIDGPLDGPMTLALTFLGSNPDVLYGAQFKFNTVIEGELFNIARSLKPGSNLSSFKRYIEMDRKVSDAAPDAQAVIPPN